MAIISTLRDPFRKWIIQFLECDGLGVLLESLEKLGTRGFSSLADTFSQLQCVGCLRAVMNSDCGLQFIIKRRDYTRQLVSDEELLNYSNSLIRRLVRNQVTVLIELKPFLKNQITFPDPRSFPHNPKSSHQLYKRNLFPRICDVLQSRDRVVKMQVFELLCALSMYSTKGHTLALDALNHFKMCHGRRYRLDLIIEELRSADTAVYRTTLMAFVNCLIFGYNDVRQRTRLRNEFFGVGLGPLLDKFRASEDKDLQIQLIAFENQQRADEEELEPLSLQQLFDIVFEKIANTPQSLYLHGVLLNLSQIENYNSDMDKMWELLEEVTSNAVKSKKLGYDLSRSRKIFTRDVGTQTIGGGKRWNGLIKKNNCKIYHNKSPPETAQNKINSKFCTVGTQSDNECFRDDRISSSIGIQVEISKNCDSCKPSTDSLLLNIKPEESSTSLSSVSLFNGTFSSITGLTTTSSSISLPLSEESVSSQQSENKGSYEMNSSYSESDVVISKNPLSYSPIPPAAPPLPYFGNMFSVNNDLQCNNLTIPSLSSHLINQDSDFTKVPNPPPLPDLVIESENYLPLTQKNSSMNGKKTSDLIIPVPPPLCSLTSSNKLKNITDEIPENSLPPSPIPPPLPLQKVVTNSDNGSDILKKSEDSSSSKMVLQPCSPPLPPPPPEICNNQNNMTSSFVQSTCKLFMGHMSLPNKRNSPFNSEYMSKFHTLPHPNTKMKTLNWTKVPNKSVERSLWSNTELPDLPVDYNKMEELFCQKPKDKSGSCSSTTLKLNRLSKTTLSTVNLLENKRSLAVNIFLKQFKTGSDFVINAVNAGNGLSVEKLKALRRLLPDKDELAAIRTHKTEDGPLGTAEKFFLELAEIKHFELRVEAMLQKEECPTSINELSPSLDKILEGCTFLIEDTNLKQFLKIVLHLGNYLNAGSYAGNAVGFKLNTLPKLLETRANKPRVTFLHFVVEVAQNHDPDVMNFRKNLTQLRELSRTPLSNIEDEVKLISTNIKDLKKKLTSAGNQDIFDQFKDFISVTEMNIELLNNKIGKVKETSNQLALHFCEDPLTFHLDECFSLFADFFEKLGYVILENEQRRKQEEISEKHFPDKKNKSIVKRKKSRINDENDCVVDLLMKEIRGGTFKLRKTAKTHESN